VRNVQKNAFQAALQAAISEKVLNTLYKISAKVYDKSSKAVHWL